LRLRRMCRPNGGGVRRKTEQKQELSNPKELMQWSPFNVELPQIEARPNNYHWLICRIEDDLPIGAVGLEYTWYKESEGEGILLKENAVIDFSAMLVGLHYAVGKDFQRLGYGTEAAAEIVGYAFTFPEINRIVNVIDAENEDSDKLMRRLKFTLTPAPPNIIGILTSSLVKPSTSAEAESAQSTNWLR